MVNGVADQLCSMAVFVSMPMMAGVKELAPGRSANPMLGGISSGLHEVFGGSTYLLWRLFERQLEPGSQLFPEGWPPPFPRSDGGDGRQWFVTCPEAGASSLSSPRVFLQKVLLCA